ncbi:uncharacterized protein LOC113367622 [Ctenocephalides felis]|uniref:uncharacterized protein LOC113367622 n=1 Tax=Ctenocephalides felis TaxID=7515 RepID=UPI000E6E56E1|nr:uncharacterized protein LOC113367622 [Ctenocephalides felis]
MSSEIIILDISNTCRTCLAQNHNMHSVTESIKTAQNNNFVIRDMLMSCTKIQISENDGLPPQICLKCVCRVSDAYLFKLNCEKSEKTLRDNLLSKSSEIPMEDIEQSQIANCETFKDNVMNLINIAVEETNSFDAALTLVSQSEKNNDIMENQSNSTVELNYKKRKAKTRYKPANKTNSKVRKLVKIAPKQNDDKNQIISENIELKAQCKICSIYFIYENELQMHLAEVHGINSSAKYLCSICNIEFPDSDKLNEHNLLEHTYRCDECLNWYSTKELLKKHKCLVHRKTPELSCNICQKNFQTLRGLTIHKTLHNIKSKEEKISCKICDRTFSVVSNLTYHMKFHKSYVCHYCNSGFYNFASMKAHMKRDHDGKKPYSCTFCNKTFNYHKLSNDEAKQKVDKMENLPKSFLNICEINEKSEIDALGFDNSLCNNNLTQFIDLTNDVDTNNITLNDDGTINIAINDDALESIQEEVLNPTGFSSENIQEVLNQTRFLSGHQGKGLFLTRLSSENVQDQVLNPTESSTENMQDKSLNPTRFLSENIQEEGVNPTGISSENIQEDGLNSTECSTENMQNKGLQNIQKGLNPSRFFSKHIQQNSTLLFSSKNIQEDDINQTRFSSENIPEQGLNQTKSSSENIQKKIIFSSDHIQEQVSDSTRFSSENDQQGSNLSSENIQDKGLIPTRFLSDIQGESLNQTKFSSGNMQKKTRFFSENIQNEVSNPSRFSSKHVQEQVSKQTRFPSENNQQDSRFLSENIQDEGLISTRFSSENLQKKIRFSSENIQKEVSNPNGFSPENIQECLNPTLGFSSENNQDEVLKYSSGKIQEEVSNPTRFSAQNILNEVVNPTGFLSENIQDDGLNQTRFSSENLLFSDSIKVLKQEIFADNKIETNFSVTDMGEYTVNEINRDDTTNIMETLKNNSPDVSQTNVVINDIFASGKIVDYDESKQQYTLRYEGTDYVISADGLNQNQNQTQSDLLNDDVLESNDEVVANTDDCEAFTCKLCNITFIDEVSFADHIPKHNTDAKSLDECKTLQKTAIESSAEISDGMVRINVDSNTGSVSYEKSDVIFSEQDYAQVSKGEELDVPRYRCPKCDDLFTRQYSLNRHLAHTHNEMCLVCNTCGESFNRVSLLEEHRSKHKNMLNMGVIITTANESFEENLESQNSMQEIESLYVYEPENQSYPCELCNKTFQMQIYLERHRLVHMGITQPGFMCSICNKIFLTSVDMQKHKRKHNEEYLQCNLCDRTFTTIGGLKYHLKTHTGTKNHKCPFCGKKFTANVNLNAHIKTVHSEVKPHLCNICGKRYTTIDHLRKHMVYHTGERKFQCNVCGKDFTQNSHLTQHSWIHSGIKPYACKYCDNKYTSSSALKKHLQTNHMQMNQ